MTTSKWQQWISADCRASQQPADTSAHAIVDAGPDYGESAAAGDVHRFVEELFYEVASHSALPGLPRHQASNRDFTEVGQKCLLFLPHSAPVIAC